MRVKYRQYSLVNILSEYHENPLEKSLLPIRSGTGTSDYFHGKSQKVEMVNINFIVRLSSE